MRALARPPSERPQQSEALEIHLRNVGAEFLK
jgi:hypothetical protein